MKTLLRSTYFVAKPWLPHSLRMAVRRWVARKKRARCGAEWPVKPGTERRPEGWPGWPDGKQFALVLTHDVEGAKGLGRCAELARLEAGLGLKAGYYFIPEGGYAVAKELRDQLTDQGFEVGVHDLRHDGKLFFSRSRFLADARRINHYLKEWNAAGFRAGFMLHDLEWLKELNTRYDASTFDTDPFEPQPDGVGTIFPFWVPGADGHGYVELPYTLPQDSTLYLLLGERGPDIWKKKLDWVAEHGGMAMLTTHPDYMALGAEKPGPMEYSVSHYEEFLLYVRARYEGRYWLALPKEVAEFTREPLRAAARVSGRRVGEFPVL